MCASALLLASAALGGASALQSLTADSPEMPAQQQPQQQPMARRRRRPQGGAVNGAGPDPLSLLTLDVPQLLGQ